MSRLTRIAFGAVLCAATSYTAELLADDPAVATPQAQVDQFAKEQAQATQALQVHRDAAPFQQAGEIRVPSTDGRILGFCVTPSGELAVITGTSQEYGEGLLATLSRAISGGSKSPPSRVQWLDASGKTLRSAELDFLPKAVNVAADGAVFVVGMGKIASFDAQGRKVQQIDSPHLAKAVADPEQFADDVMERHREEVAQIKEQAAQFADALQELEAKDAGKRTESEKLQLQQAQVLQTHFAQQFKLREAMTQDAVVAEAMTRLKEIHRVAISKDHVFVVTNESSGYGFCIWRMNHQLADAKKIVSGLSGCCGQMDVQVMGEQLVIAENSRHRVAMFDFEGKSKLNFGSANRVDVAKGFGGCCNPMNTCCDPSGALLTSESNGLVKRYSPAGEFQAVVGVAAVTEGCKNSSIGIAPDGAQLYYFDVTKGEILVLKKKA
ncbi:MAG: hypothetical protein U0939_20170 [Pirellulales bacterium]